MTPREKILWDAIFLYFKNVENRGEDYSNRDGYKLLLDAVSEFNKIKDGPTENDKKRLRSVIEGLNTAMARETHGDIILNAFKWTTTELAKSWGMK